MKIWITFVITLTAIVQSLAFPNDKNINERSAATTVKFFLFTKRNPNIGEEIVASSDESIAKSNFDAGNPTRFLVHGWRGNSTSQINTSVRDAYLEQPDDYNIFVVDWNNNGSIANYIASRMIVDTSAEQLAYFIEWLQIRHDLLLDTVFVIGHNLGAHIAGLAGKRFPNQQINTIFGLNPAFPMFSFDSTETRLTSTDAFYVQTVQSNRGQLGFQDPIGIASFYPQWGLEQPGCQNDPIGICSDEKAVQYFAESIRGERRFLGFGCDSFILMLQKVCHATMLADMGGLIPDYKAKGPFYLSIFPS